MFQVEPSVLYIVGTPIGNLGDVTHRAVEVLSGVDKIFAEDTRVSRTLLSRYGIEKPLASYRESAERFQVDKAIEQVVAALRAESSVAYISDAGTPGLSDPGSYLVSKVVEAGYKVVPVPGPSALATLISAAGFACQRPLFVGFLPKKKGHQSLVAKLREALLTEVCDSVVLYESPERIIKLLEELLEWEVPLQVCLGRELTKLHEEILRGPLEEVAAELRARKTVKGEISLVIARGES